MWLHTVYHVYTVIAYIRTQAHTRKGSIYMLGNTRTGSGIPLFFKLWFAFCAILSLSIFAVSIFLLYTVVSDPSVIGRFVGEIQQGYTSTVNESVPQQ